MKLLLLVLIIFGSTLLIAHPASEVNLVFDNDNSMLSVNFKHDVKDVDKHFIFEILVFLNQDQIIEQKITRQDKLEGGTLSYKIIDAKPGDTIKVKTNCNKTGKKSAEIEI
ncbi:MAG: hypothetical protein K9N07_00230 [Candidatus Cloacimonetes bacterium]|nr:hypothetical protein [Candidatus Cloacimonadota bacterium]